MLPVLLTASVDTRGMNGAKFSAKEREKMYVDTLNYYIMELSNRPGHFILIFAENSGWNSKSIMDKLANRKNVSVEYISLDPNLFVQEKGKSYNEMKLIDMAIDRSVYIQQANAFFKVTGRFPILNIYKLLNEVDKRGGVNMKFYCDCKDHSLYDWLHLPINGHAGECRYYAVSLPFYNKYFRGRYLDLCDYEGNTVENLFLQVIRKTKSFRGVYCRFKLQAHLTGTGGHSLGNGLPFFYSTDNDFFSLKMKRIIRQWLRWILPCWWC